MDTMLETKNIKVCFGDLVANDHVDFVCEKGSIVSLLGENGAGKTTLMKVVYGLCQPQEGQILFEGEEVAIKSPQDAIRLGIQMVHQHFMLVNHLTVADNIVMGNEPRKFGIYRRKEAEKIARDLSEQYGLYLDPKQKVGNLSVGEKQRTEIIKALYHSAKLLILDEPTAVLTPQEIRDLFKVIQRLKEEGKSVILITHKLHETMAIADKVFVLRNGVMAGCVDKKDTNTKELTKMMVGRELNPFKRISQPIGDVMLQVHNLTYVNHNGTKILDNLSIDIHAGEIYGLAGIEGNGQQDLIEVVCGIIKGWTGEVKIEGQSIFSKNVQDIINMNISCIHSDRHDRGLLLDMDAKSNVLLGYQKFQAFRTKFGLLNWGKIANMAKNVFEKLNVKPNNVDNATRGFSGGNQQKILIGRELERQPKLALVAHPTRGIDIGACETIHQSILELRGNGSAILLITADFDELFKLSDRIGVLYEGRLMTEGKAEDYTPNELGYYMGGGDGCAKEK